MMSRGASGDLSDSLRSDPLPGSRPGDVGRELLTFGRQLEAEGAAQVGGSFTGNACDDAILKDPNAFLFGVLFTQGIPAERAWSGPARLRERLGTLELTHLASRSELVREAIQRPPMLHRFKETLPAWVSGAASRLLAEYESDASRIWSAGSTLPEVIERLMRFDGIGRKKAVMAVQILTRHFGVELTGRESGQVAYDVQVRRVFLRTGLAEADTIESIEMAAVRVSPASPGTLDLAAWLIGRQTCRPRNPRCDECRLGDVCPRLTTITPRGVGVRPW
jgi:uncharacterized HhH-GPD family protein